MHVLAGEGQRKRDTQNQAPHCRHGAWHGARSHKSWDHDLSWNQESDAQPTEPPRRPKTWGCKSCLQDAHSLGRSSHINNHVSVRLTSVPYLPPAPARKWCLWAASNWQEAKVLVSLLSQNTTEFVLLPSLPLSLHSYLLVEREQEQREGERGEEEGMGEGWRESARHLVQW